MKATEELRNLQEFKGRVKKGDWVLAFGHHNEGSMFVGQVTQVSKATRREAGFISIAFLDSPTGVATSTDDGKWEADVPRGFLAAKFKNRDEAYGAHLALKWFNYARDRFDDALRSITARFQLNIVRKARAGK